MKRRSQRTRCILSISPPFLIWAKKTCWTWVTSTPPSSTASTRYLAKSTTYTRCSATTMVSPSTSSTKTTLGPASTPSPPSLPHASIVLCLLRPLKAQCRCVTTCSSTCVHFSFLLGILSTTSSYLVIGSLTSRRNHLVGLAIC